MADVVLVVPPTERQHLIVPYPAKFTQLEALLGDFERNGVQGRAEVGSPQKEVTRV